MEYEERESSHERSEPLKYICEARKMYHDGLLEQKMYWNANYDQGGKTLCGSFKRLVKRRLRSGEY